MMRLNRIRHQYRVSTELGAGFPGDATGKYRNEALQGAVSKMLEDFNLDVFSVHFIRQAAPDERHTQYGRQHAQPLWMNEVGVFQIQASTLQCLMQTLHVPTPVQL